MKNFNFPKLFFLVLILNFTTTVYGQKNYQSGYIINLSGDTIHGVINYRNWDNNPRKIAFKKSVENEDEYYSPAAIRGFYVADEAYKSAIVKVDMDSYEIANLKYSEEYHYRVDTAFLQILVKSDKNLYRYKDMNSKEHFLIGQDPNIELLHFKKYFVDVNGKKTIKENNKFKGQLYYYLRDCPEINKKIINTQYSQLSLSRLLSEYYSCKNGGSKLTVKREKSTIDFGVFTGLSITKLTFKGIYSPELVEPNYSSSLNMSFGLFLDYYLPKNLKKWSIYNEILYTSYNTNGTYRENSHVIMYTTLEYSYLKMNNMLRYNYPVGRASLFVNAGMSNGMAVKETNYKKTVNDLRTNPVSEGKAVEATKKYEPGYVVGLGSKIKRFSLEARFEKSKGMSEYINLTSPTTRFYFLLGYRFQFVIS